MQQATHPRLHVRDAHDAHTIFEAVRQGFLRPISRRLNELERATHVRSGAIFVWVESDDDAGLKRWTGKNPTSLGSRNLLTNKLFVLDGRVWGQSRMREVRMGIGLTNVFDLSLTMYSRTSFTMKRSLTLKAP